MARALSELLSWLDEAGVAYALQGSADTPIETRTFDSRKAAKGALFAALPEGEAKLAPVLRQAMARDAASGEHHRGQWWDIGTPERLDELDRLLTQR